MPASHHTGSRPVCRAPGSCGVGGLDRERTEAERASDSAYDTESGAETPPDLAQVTSRTVQRIVRPFRRAEAGDREVADKQRRVDRVEALEHRADLRQRRTLREVDALVGEEAGDVTAAGRGESARVAGGESGASPDHLEREQGGDGAADDQGEEGEEPEPAVADDGEGAGRPASKLRGLEAGAPCRRPDLGRARRRK